MLNVVRLIEMRQGELFQIPGGQDSDYLFVLEGKLEVIQNGMIVSTMSSDAALKRQRRCGIERNSSAQTQNSLVS